jgi:serine/threonine protein phosphatase PrpC
VDVELAELSLEGDRQQNQDRVKVICDADALLLIAVDGMGGHSEGEKAAEVTVGALSECFFQIPRPMLDPQGFLTLALARAHDQVVALGRELPLDHRPRATCAVCLVQDSTSYWAHVGDSRLYQLRNDLVHRRTRDHSHVELLLREGLIAERDVKSHPMRNFVECCLGGDVALPDMSVTGSYGLSQGDVLLACTDGFWSGLEDEEIAAALKTAPLTEALRELCERAVARNTPHSDNTSAVGARWLG